MVYMTKVSDAASADGSSAWFKIFQDGWAKNPSGASGDDDYWGTKDLNTCCGRISVKIPSDIPAGDYLLRAEVIALHTAGSSGGAQLYMTCYQITVSGGGSATPSPTVNFPGAYKASDPGILVNIHAALATYVVPGPAVYSGGSTRAAGGACTGCEATCSPGSAPGVTLTATAPAATGTSGSGGGSCEAQKYQQCGGTGYTGCTVCAVSSVLDESVMGNQGVLTELGIVGLDLQRCLAAVLLAVRVRTTRRILVGSERWASSAGRRVLVHSCAGRRDCEYASSTPLTYSFCKGYVLTKSLLLAGNVRRYAVYPTRRVVVCESSGVQGLQEQGLGEEHGAEEGLEGMLRDKKGPTR